MATRVKQPESLTKNRRAHPAQPLPRVRSLAYLLRAALLYLLFNVFVGPSNLWLDIFSGWRYGHSERLLLPFVQGSFYFYAIVLNSDSIFRAFQEAFILKKLYVPPIIYGLVFANLTLILVTFLDFFSRQQEISDRLVMLRAGILPCQPATLLPAVADQLWLLAFTLLAGFLMNQFLTGSEISQSGIYQHGEEL
jgi:hypothetical protein